MTAVRPGVEGNAPANQERLLHLPSELVQDDQDADQDDREDQALDGEGNRTKNPPKTTTPMTGMKLLGR